MRYTEAHFRYTFAEDWQQALFEQHLADLGFEAFTPAEDEKEVVGYIQTSLLDEASLRQDVAATDGVTLLALRHCPDQNWNATWEEEHPEFTLQVAGETLTIVPNCAFGAGYHETTAMMLDALSDRRLWLRGKQVLDNGCGTGVLGIAAARLGAESVVAVDVDEHSVSSTRDNALRNGVSVDVRWGDTPPQGVYDLILSNIHRNILLQQMSLYARYLAPQGELWLSGFLEDDCPALLQAAETVGLHLVQSVSRHEWRMLCFQS